MTDTRSGPRELEQQPRQASKAQRPTKNRRKEKNKMDFAITINASPAAVIAAAVAIVAVIVLRIVRK